MARPPTSNKPPTGNTTRRAFACAVLVAAGMMVSAPVIPAPVVPAPVAPALGAPQRPDPIIAAQLVERINAVRAQAGLPPVALDPALSQAAQAFAEDLAQRRTLDHRDARGADLETRVHATGYRFGFVAENVAAMWATPDRVVANWMASPDNRANLLALAAEDAGVGFVLRADDNIAAPGIPPVGYRYYWVLDLASKLVREPGN